MLLCYYDILDCAYDCYSKLYTREDINKTKEDEILNSIKNKINEFENEACDKDIYR